MYMYLLKHTTLADLEDGRRINIYISISTLIYQKILQPSSLFLGNTCIY
jgi:hypothetical protein